MKRDVLRAFRPMMATMVELAAPRRTAAITTDDLARLRLDLRKQLTALKGELSTQLTERESYLALFAVVVHLDELVQTTYIGDNHLSWPSLQKEFFDTDKGGDLFYQALDDLLDGRQYAAVVYEVYYFCLRVGFRGRYVQDEDKVAQYMKKLAARVVGAPAGMDEIEIDLELDKPEAAGRSVQRLRLFGSELWYYLAAVAVIVAIYFVMSARASRESTRWQERSASQRSSSALLLNEVEWAHS